MASAPDRHGQGIGHSCMAAAKHWVSSRGMPKIQLMVRRSNTAIVDFYSALSHEEQECLVLGRRFDGSSGDAVPT